MKMKKEPALNINKSIGEDKEKVVNEKVYIEKSSEKRDLKIYILGNKTNRNKIAIIGSMHGDEPQGKYIIDKLIEYIKDNPKIIKNIQILFIPVANPDGLYMDTRVNANKVDLNRNFPTKDWVEEGENTRYYSGSGPASEPETRILIRYINEFNPKLIINIHSPLKVVNYDGDGKQIAKLMAKYNKYKVEGNIGYPTPGSFGTYFGKERNIPVITLETGPESNHKAWKENKDGILAVIKYCSKKIHGKSYEI